MANRQDGKRYFSVTLGNLLLILTTNPRIIASYLTPEQRSKLFGRANLV